MPHNSIKEFVRKELIQTAEAISETAANLTNEIEAAVDLLMQCKGKIVVTGMGKTGIIGRKISATLASTGSTSVFLHAAEGIHGDLGMISKDDAIIAISYSGGSQELLSIIPYFKFLQLPVIAMTGNRNSALAQSADVIIDCSVSRHIEPFGLVPTASTTVTLALGDAIAVALLKKKDFRINDYALFHPGGTIGRKLLLKVEDLMHSAERNPVIHQKKSMKEVIMVMTSKGLGCTSVIDDRGILLGIVTDGDLRRLLSKEGNILEMNAEEMMTPNPKRVTSDLLAVEALNLMENYKITMLPVTDIDNKPVGMLHMHDLVNAGVV